VILTSDLEEGGYTVTCKEVPAAISQAETVQEALDNITEVLEEHFEHVEGIKTGKPQPVKGSYVETI
jgi:predicted RNase H-like HicB family nuclease